MFLSSGSAANNEKLISSRSQSDLCRHILTSKLDLRTDTHNIDIQAERVN